MKKVLTLIVGIMLSMNAFSQKTVAVYVTPNDEVPQQTSKILGSELVAAITRNADYIAIERTADFLAQITEEQGQYNNLDDTKLFELGKEYGASNVCVADITKFGEEYYIVARLLDIRTSRVWRTARKSSGLKSLNELIEVSESLADELFGNTKEFSTYAYGDNGDNKSFIIKIENRENYTKVTFKYVSTSPTQRIGIKNTTYIEDLLTHEKFNLIDVANINITNENNKNYKTIGEGIWEYSLIFKRINEDAKNIMIVEPNGWAYKDIVLKPYGDENTFVFEDNTQQVYDDLLERARIKQRQLEEEYNNTEYSTYAYGDNGNNKSRTINGWFNSYQNKTGEVGDNRSFIIKIENSGSYTKVTCKFLSIYEDQKLGISEDTYIEDMNTHIKYKLKNASNITISSSVRFSAVDQYSIAGKGIIEYTLYFERIPEQTRNIRIIERYGFDSSGWEYKNIVLKPYGQKDLYVFEDNTQNEYQILLKTFVYYIDFENRHSDPRNVYMNGKYIGQVKGYGRKKLEVPIYEFGLLNSVQASGYIISPNEESFTISYPTKGSTYTIKN